MDFLKIWKCRFDKLPFIIFQFRLRERVSHHKKHISTCLDYWNWYRIGISTSILTLRNTITGGHYPIISSLTHPNRYTCKLFALPTISKGVLGYFKRSPIVWCEIHTILDALVSKKCIFITFYKPHATILICFLQKIALSYIIPLYTTMPNDVVWILILHFQILSFMPKWHPICKFWPPKCKFPSNYKLDLHETYTKRYILHCIITHQNEVFPLAKHHFHFAPFILEKVHFFT